MIFNNTSNQIVIYCLISFWLLIKYILGQYERKENFNSKEIIKVIDPKDSSEVGSINPSKVIKVLFGG